MKIGEHWIISSTNVVIELSSAATMSQILPYLYIKILFQLPSPYKKIMQQVKTAKIVHL